MRKVWQVWQVLEGTTRSELGRKELPQGKSIPRSLFEEGTIKKVSINGTVTSDTVTPQPPWLRWEAPRAG
ncbi:hypothetical protein PEX1_026650 [Penicillium expansum]|uniref:Uncharacterized protein n=1 Tax=Penicillium expansum TaxID=27334 RepID=A0A0A2IM30_PENEN|nr:hypothetical protein PEX2_036770 [Penicillium expansum]KGO41268.1 hypothetical protein PEXP_106480 [Penicillium expansum]KGO44137.1 hypothetical protein PEX1_026650 [Penicillium expansum]KGO50506.1 hypothetical protein PEX2_036770 [Penicillium expansum]